MRVDSPKRKITRFKAGVHAYCLTLVALFIFGLQSNSVIADESIFDKVKQYDISANLQYYYSADGLSYSGHDSKIEYSEKFLPWDKYYEKQIVYPTPAIIKLTFNQEILAKADPALATLAPGKYVIWFVPAVNTADIHQNDGFHDDIANSLPIIAGSSGNGYLIDLEPGKKYSLIYHTELFGETEDLQPRAFILPLTNHLKLSNRYTQINALFYGSAICLLLCNFIVFLMLRNSSYGYYTLYIATFIFFMLEADGIMIRMTGIFSPSSIAPPLFLTSAIYLIFISKSLDLKSNLTRWEKNINLISYVGLGAVPLILLFGTTRNLMTYVLAGTLYGCMVYATTLCLLIISFKRNTPGVKFLLASEIVIISGFFLSALIFINSMLENSSVLASLMLAKISIILEVIFASLGLADKTRAAELQKEKALDEKKQEHLKTKARSQFFASMSHELRTPLTAILGYSEAALPDDVGFEEKKKSLATINRSGLHLLQIINDILDLSKIDAGKMQVDIIDTDLFALLHEVDGFFSILANKKDIEFNITHQYPLPPTIKTDPLRLKQALINLCGNAVKFTDKGGVAIDVSYQSASNLLLFAVKDTGIGLKPEQILDLFNAFTQADASTARNFGGTGLGLHLSKQLALSLGGDISVTSEYGKGTTFTVAINPGTIAEDCMVYSPPKTQEPVEEKNITIPRLSAKILYAEDNVDNQNLIRKIIEHTGASIDVVDNGQQALDVFHQNHYDLLLTDIRMPVLGGVELASILLKEKPKLPIIAITANMMEHDLRIYQHVGFKAFLEKPIKREHLYFVLAKYLQPPTAAEPEARVADNSDKVKILLAEDNLDNQGLIKLHIKRSGANVVAVVNGTEALEKALTEEFDLILMDMQMPVMDGMEAVRRLRKVDYIKPIFALTANESDEAIQECLNAGCQGHLAKPLNVAKLSEVIAGIERSRQVSSKQSYH